MDNPKIIFLNVGNEIVSEEGTYKLTRNERHIVISETESFYFFYRKKIKYFIYKDEVKKLTYKYRCLDFNDLNRDEILNVISNYSKILHKCKVISKTLSLYSDSDYNMSALDNSQITVTVSDDSMLLKSLAGYSAKIALKYLWDHNWKKQLIIDYTK